MARRSGPALFAMNVVGRKLAHVVLPVRGSDWRREAATAGFETASPQPHTSPFRGDTLPVPGEVSRRQSQGRSAVAIQVEAGPATPLAAVADAPLRFRSWPTLSSDFRRSRQRHRPLPDVRPGQNSARSRAEVEGPAGLLVPKVFTGRSCRPGPGSPAVEGSRRGRPARHRPT